MITNIFKSRLASTLIFKPKRQMSMWKKLVPKFMQGKDKKPQQTELVHKPQDEVRQKIMDAEIQEIIELGKKPQEEWVSKASERESQARVDEKIIHEKVSDFKEQQLEDLGSPPVYSIWEIMSETEELEDGSIQLPLLLDNDGHPKKFENIAAYEEWFKQKENEIIQKRKEALSPHEFFLVQARKMERPFTGTYWWLKDMGTYSCKVCSQKLFITEHKYQTDNGYANFWNHVLDAVSYKDDHLHNHDPHCNNSYIAKNFREEMPEKRAV